MPDVLEDKKISEKKVNEMMQPLELDLSAVFNIIQGDLLKLLDNVGADTSPDRLIQTIEDTLNGNISIDTAQTITKSENPITDSIKVFLRQIIVYGDIPIRIEQEVNSTRSGYDNDGHYWESKFFNLYGYFEDTMGVDGDEVDVYLGEYLNTDMIFIIHQRDPVTQEYDEDKVMMFFETPEEAKKTYLKHYDRPGMFGGLTEVDIDQFRRMLRDRQGSKLTSKGMGNGDDKDILINSLSRLKDFLNGKNSH